MGNKPPSIIVARGIIQDNRDNVLLLKRINGDTHNPDLWEFPGGKLETGQDLTQGRDREVFEETGLQIAVSNPLAYVESYIIESGRYMGTPYFVVVSLARVISGRLQLSTEHAKSAWVEPADVLDFPLTKEYKNAFDTLKNSI